MIVAVASSLVGLALLFPDRHEASTPLTEGGQLPPRTEDSVKRTGNALAEPLAVTEKFLNTAVARRHVADSWELIHPSFPGKEEFTKKTWAKGNIPVVPFPVADARYRVDYSYKNELGLRIVLIPPRGDKTPRAIFDVELRRSGRGENRKWLIDSYMPSGQIQSGGGGYGTARGISGLPNLDPKARPDDSSRLGPGWLLVPLSVLILALLTPIGVGITNSVRARRAARDFARGA